jgi:glucokinase
MKKPGMETESQSEKPILAVDIGGTKLAVALVSQEGKTLSRSQEPTYQDGPEHNIAQIIRLLEKLLADRNLKPGDAFGIGVGIPAVLERGTDFVIWGPNLAGWRNVALRPALEAHFGLPVCVEYDGHTAVLGEWWTGAGRGYQSVVDIIIGTGVGGGMILDGQLARGVNRLAGAVGWFTFRSGAATESDLDRSIGYWEARTAGPGIARRAQEYLAGHRFPCSILENNANPITARQVFSAAEMGDALALAVCAEFADLLGSGIANIISLVNPEVIILGGSVGANAGFLIPHIHRVAASWAQPISVTAVQIVPSTLGGEAGLIGAAYSALLRFGR